MKSKELNEIFNKTRRTPDISLTPKQVEELIKDLEQKELLETELKLEKDKVKYVMKQLEKQDKILEILKPYFRGAVFPSAINFNFNEKDWKPIKEWLESGKN